MTARRQIWKKSFYLFLMYSFGGSLRKEPHMVAFARSSSNSYIACKHFVTWRINLMHYMVNKINTKFKKLFFPYLSTEVSHSCFSRIFVKVYIAMGRLKRYKKAKKCYHVETMPNGLQCNSTALFISYQFEMLFWIDLKDGVRTIAP